MRSNRIPARKFSFGLEIPEFSFMAPLSLSEKRRWYSVLRCSYIVQINQESTVFYRLLWCVARALYLQLIRNPLGLSGLKGFIQ